MRGIYTVHAVTPALQIKKIAADEPAPAKILGGVGYTPVVGERVVAELIEGRFYIFGRA